MTLVRENNVQQINAALQSLQRLVDNNNSDAKNQLEASYKQSKSELEKMAQSIRDRIDMSQKQKIEISSSRSMSVSEDTKAIIVAPNVTLTLLADGSVNNSILELYTTDSTSIVYYTDSSTTSSLSMTANTRVTFLYRNGWKLNGAYGAVWN